MRKFQINMHDVSIKMQKQEIWNFILAKWRKRISFYTRCISFGFLCSSIEMNAYLPVKLVQPACFY